jgi:hypothetical protein
MSDPSPTLLLSLAIKKRRALMTRKERDFRKELLVGNTISRLCKHIGEQRALRKRHADVAANENRQSPSSSSDNHSDRSGSCSVEYDSASTHSDHDQHSPASARRQCRAGRRRRSASRDQVVLVPASDSIIQTTAYDDDDPFGLNAFFESLRSRGRKLPRYNNDALAECSKVDDDEALPRPPMHEQMQMVVCIDDER